MRVSRRGHVCDSHEYPDPIVTLKLLPKDLVVRRKLSIFATDTKKLVLGGMVFGNLFADKKYTYYIIAAGLLIFIILLWIGNYYFNKGNKNI